MTTEREISEIINSQLEGDESISTELTQQIYQELKKLARGFMSRERSNHTLQATALVNEVYLKMTEAKVFCADKKHFFAIASKMMRRILVDHARSHLREKRGAGAKKVTLNESVIGGGKSDPSIIALDDALTALQKIDERKAHTLELQYFAGLSVPEIADYFQQSPRTVEREIQFAKAFLYKELSDD
jgi:RNA polymerase sigma factor (TIGR02999 family)